MLDKEYKEIEEMENERIKYLAELQQIWKKQTMVRRQKAEEIMNLLRPHPEGKPLVEIKVFHQANLEELVHILSEKIPDKRKLDEKDLKAVIERLSQELETKHCITSSDVEQRPLDYFIAEVRKGKDSELLKDVLRKRLNAFLEVFSEPVLRSLETQEVSDYVYYYVYRRDGTLAGSIDKVSAGQRGTAILYLLLSGGEEPLLIDTPEEGLDNEGIYAELVPLFRKEKEKRQIIIITHNANLPVNADAEGIIALETVGFVPENKLAEIIAQTGKSLNPDQQRHLAELIKYSDWTAKVREYLTARLELSGEALDTVIQQIGLDRAAEGRVKKLQLAPTLPQREAIGALDIPEVKKAVQDIMEGSEDAFKRRKEKYGF